MNAWDMDPNGYAPLLKLVRQWWQARRAAMPQKHIHPEQREQGCRA